MSAEVLREAAALMRDRAMGSTAGPWFAVEQTHGEWYGLQSQWTALGNAFEKIEADHIASWHPAVALAVADWLDWTADRADSGNGIPAMRGRGLEQALKVARVYLGAPS